MPAVLFWSHPLAERDYLVRPRHPREPDVSALPETVREHRWERAVNDAKRSRGVVSVDTGNVERRLREARWRERSDRFRERE